MNSPINLPELLSELVDETAIDKPLNWEGLNFEAMKPIAIAHVIELFSELPHTARTLQLMATMAYLLIENTQLWTENLASKRGLKLGPGN